MMKSELSGGPYGSIAVVLEVNEIPPEVLETFIRRYPDSHLARLSVRAQRTVTVADDIAACDLYPSQSWASINSGVRYEDHGVRWYNDPKDDCPLIWDELALSRSVGVVNSVHSSSFDNVRALEYCIPDPYSDAGVVVPESLEGFQRFKRRHTLASGRLSSFGVGADDFRDARSFARQVSLRSCVSLGDAAVARLIRGRPERLRNVEFELHADLFLRLLRPRRAQINVFFTNHVASQMHRYIGALFPNPEVRESFGQDWIVRFGDEVMHSLRLFDRRLGQILEIVDLHRDSVVLMSSMGQGVKSSYDESHRIIFVNDVERFMSAVASAFVGRFTVQGAMVPEVSVECESESVARDLAAHLRDSTYVGMELSHLVVAGSVVTASVYVHQDAVTINGVDFEPEGLGLRSGDSDRQNTGEHIPEGVFWAVGRVAEDLDLPESMSYLGVRPMLEAALMSCTQDPLPSVPAR